MAVTGFTWWLRRLHRALFRENRLLRDSYGTDLRESVTIALKEHCTQKKIWIHLMQNIFRNQTVKNLTILDNPFKRYDFSKFSLNSVKSLCRPHKLATVPCHGCTTPHWFCTQIIANFQFSWIWVKLLIKLIPKSIQIHIYLKQTWLISRGNLLFTWELYF